MSCCGCAGPSRNAWSCRGRGLRGTEPLGPGANSPPRSSTCCTTLPPLPLLRRGEPQEAHEAAPSAGGGTATGLMGRPSAPQRSGRTAGAAPPGRRSRGAGAVRMRSMSRCTCACSASSTVVGPVRPGPPRGHRTWQLDGGRQGRVALHFRLEHRQRPGEGSRISSTSPSHNACRLALHGRLKAAVVIEPVTDRGPLHPDGVAVS